MIDLLTKQVWMWSFMFYNLSMFVRKRVVITSLFNYINVQCMWKYNLSTKDLWRYEIMEVEQYIIFYGPLIYIGGFVNFF
jgi:hypothetical protein